jgi:hypothetical protein
VGDPAAAFGLSKKVISIQNGVHPPVIKPGDLHSWWVFHIYVSFWVMGNHPAHRMFQWGKSTLNGGFSIAMSEYRRVCGCLLVHNSAPMGLKGNLNDVLDDGI